MDNLTEQKSIERFQIKPEHQPLLDASVALGDWLVSRPEVTAEQVQAIHVLQAALRRMPEATPGLDVKYGFLVHPAGGKPDGIWRAWYVSMDDREGLSLSSYYSPFPVVAIWEQIAHELQFNLMPGQPDTNEDFYHAEWMAEVSSPEAFLHEGLYFEIDAAVQMTAPE